MKWKSLQTNNNNEGDLELELDLGTPLMMLWLRLPCFSHSLPTKMDYRLWDSPYSSSRYRYIFEAIWDPLDAFHHSHVSKGVVDVF